MSDFPSPSLVGIVQNLILETFDVSKEEARDYASGLAALAEGWGTSKTAMQVEWSYRIKKDLGEKLRWRSEEEHEKFRRDQLERFKSYEAHIKTKHRA
jgi:hypothetical protein